MADFSIKAFFGGDTSGLRAALGEANKAVNDFAKESKKAGLSLGAGFGFGVLLFQARRFFDAVINDAQKTRDEFEKVGRSVPAAVTAVAYLADGIDGLKKTTISWGTSLLGYLSEAGQGWGMFINRLRGVTAEMEKQREEAARNADKLEKERDRAFTEQAAKEKARREQEKREAERAAEKKAEDDFNNLIRVAAAQKKLDDRKKEAAYEALTLERQIIENLKQKQATEKLIADYKKNQNLSANDQIKVIELENSLLDTNNRLAEKRLALAEQTAAEEKRIAENNKEQATVLAAIAGIRTGEQFNDATDESLQEVVRRNRNASRRIRGDLANAGIAQDMERARLEVEASNAERELQFRKQFRTTLEHKGVEAARRSFKGDPLEFDRILQQLTTGLTVNDKQLTELEKIRRALDGKFINQ